DLRVSSTRTVRLTPNCSSAALRALQAVVSTACADTTLPAQLQNDLASACHQTHSSRLLAACSSVTEGQPKRRQQRGRGRGPLGYLRRMGSALASRLRTTASK